MCGGKGTHTHTEGMVGGGFTDRLANNVISIYQRAHIHIPPAQNIRANSCRVDREAAVRSQSDVMLMNRHSLTLLADIKGEFSTLLEVHQGLGSLSSCFHALSVKYHLFLNGGAGTSPSSHSESITDTPACAYTLILSLDALFVLARCGRT